jgi:hypothetical protein
MSVTVQDMIILELRMGRPWPEGIEWPGWVGLYDTGPLSILVGTVHVICIPAAGRHTVRDLTLVQQIGRVRLDDCFDTQDEALDFFFGEIRKT